MSSAPLDESKQLSVLLYDARKQRRMRSVAAISNAREDDFVLQVSVQQHTNAMPIGRDCPISSLLHLLPGGEHLSYIHCSLELGKVTADLVRAAGPLVEQSRQIRAQPSISARNMQANSSDAVRNEIGTYTYN